MIDVFHVGMSDGNRVYQHESKDGGPMRKSVVIAIVCGAVNMPVDALPAFPGALGFGAQSLGVTLQVTVIAPVYDLFPPAILIFRSNPVHPHYRSAPTQKAREILIY